MNAADNRYKRLNPKIEKGGVLLMDFDSQGNVAETFGANPLSNNNNFSINFSLINYNL